MSRVHRRPIAIPVPEQNKPQAPPKNDISQRVLHALQAKKSFENSRELAQDFAAISPNELQMVLDKLVQELLTIDPIKDIAQLAEVIPMDILQSAVKTQYPEHIDALTTAKEMFKQASYFLNKTENTLSASLQNTLSTICDTLTSILESILSAFGIADFFKPSESDVNADFKGQKIMMLVSFFSLLSSALLPLIGEALGGIIIGGTLLCIAALSIVYPYFRPAPVNLPHAENWTKQFQQGKLFVSGGRKKSLDELAETLIANKSVKTHPMLIGKTGIGKTEMIKAFVQAIERGDYPELKGMQVFYINTANLVNNSDPYGGGNKVLSGLSEAMGRHRDKIILVLDELHLACQKRDSSVLSEQLKTRLDTGNGNFPHVIGITTAEEFYRDIHLNNAAFARRFKRINIDNTEDAETLEILNNTVLQQAPKVILENGALHALLQKTKETFSEDAAQPATSLKILAKCIQKTTESQKSQLEEKIEKVRKQVVSLYSEGAVGQGKSLLPYKAKARKKQLQSLEKRLEKLSCELQHEKDELTHFFKNRDQLAAAKMATFQIASRVSNLQKNALSTKDKKELNAFLLLSHFFAPQMEASVRAQAAKLGVKTVIDPSLIDDVIQEEQENDQKAKQAVNRGKSQLRQRRR